MAYVKQTWQTGEVITQEKLNHMEDGIGSNEPLIVNLVNNTFDKTYGEVVSALNSGRYCILKVPGLSETNIEHIIRYWVSDLEGEEGLLVIGTIGVDKHGGITPIYNNVYTCSTEDGYPEAQG